MTPTLSPEDEATFAAVAAQRRLSPQDALAQILAEARADFAAAPSAHKAACMTPLRKPAPKPKTAKASLWKHSPPTCAPVTPATHPPPKPPTTPRE